MDMSKMTWKCTVCGDTRPDAKISVHVRDVSQKFGLPEGTAKHNIKYCNDRQKCIDDAPERDL